MATREIASQVLQFLLELVRTTLLKSALRLPWAMVSSMAPIVAVALFGWHLTTAPESSVAMQWTTFILWAICFIVAGTIWGLHRAAHDAIQDGIQLCKVRGAETTGALLDPLIDKLPHGKKDFRIDDVRQQWSEWTNHPIGKEDGARWYSFVSRLANWLARKWLDVQVGLVRETLDELENLGEKTVSLASLKHFVVDRSAGALAQAARQSLRKWSLAAAVAIFLLMCVPPSVAVAVAWLPH